MAGIAIPFCFITSTSSTRAFSIFLPPKIQEATAPETLRGFGIVLCECRSKKNQSPRSQRTGVHSLDSKDCTAH